MDFINELKDGYSTVKLLPNNVEDANITEAPIIKRKPLYKKVIPIVIPLLLTPTLAFAGPFDLLHGEFLKIADIFAVAVFSFAGASWMFGHRSKAIEMLIGGCIGYLLVRHAVDIRDYLKNWSLLGGVVNEGIV